MNLGKADLKFINSNQRKKISVPVATWAENITIARDVGFMNGDSGSNSPGFAKAEVWEPIIESLNKSGFLDNGEEWTNPASYLISAPTTGEYKSERVYNNKVQKIFSTIRQNQALLSPDLNQVNEEFIQNQTVDLVTRSRAELQKLSDENPGFLYGSARFIGAMNAAISDPVVQETLPLGGWAKAFWPRLFQTALINAGAGAASEVGVAKWYDELGLDYTLSDFVANVAVNAALGAAIPLAGSGIKLTANQAKNGYLALTRGNQTGPLENREVASSLLEAEEFDNAENPFESNVPNEAQYTHDQRLTEAGAAAANAQPPAMSPNAPLPIKTSSIENLDGVLYNLDPMTIEIDAKTFQFKAGGDEFGVTDRLQGITIWDKYKAGVITVYEYADGRMAIADGHQRLGLAKRIMLQDPSQDVSVIAYKLRESDGISPEQARVIAAMKNIAEGTGTAIDAAKVLRVDPSRISELPPRSEIVRQARDMIALSDAAFGAVVNGVIPPKYGAIVGRLIDDEGLQDAAIQVLAKADPSNSFQAEAIVRQVREADAEQVKQISLFGEELVTESLYVERAKVLDRAYKELRRDKAAFETLVKNAERLEAEGNVLAADANQRKATTDAQTITLLQALANRKGPLSDALSAAARTARDTNNYGPATSGFLDAVRRSIDSGDFESISSGDIGRGVDGTAEVTRPTVEEPILDGFDEPTGPASDQQTGQLMTDMFGADEVAPAAPVRTIEEIEVDLKARQPVETVDEIYALADESQSYIATIGAEIESDLGVSFKNPGLKDIDAAREKMQRKGYASSNQMTDISRGGFIINKAEDADAIVARFGRDAEILDEGWNFTPAGYFDRKILVRTPNGIVSEIQIWSPKVLAAKQKTGHKLYKKLRKSKDPAEIESLSIQMRELYSNALRSEDQSFRSLSGIDNLPKVASNADINAASSGITRPVSKTSGPSTDVQAPPGSSIATASVGEVEIAGRPSQLTNIMDDTSDLNLDITSADVNLDLEVPVGQRLNPDTNELESVSMTIKDLRTMINEEDTMMKRLEFCTV
tara:strand:+ start:2569 stop:5712 length:3144 start_codon:yes stop_codon:yes gene_type:complete